MLNEIKNIVAPYLMQVLIGAIAFLSALVLTLSINLYFTSEERDEYMAKVEAINAVSIKEEQRHRRQLKIYDKNIKDIVDFYESEKNNVDNFTRRVDETDCEAAYRFFDRSRY